MCMCILINGRRARWVVEERRDVANGEVFGQPEFRGQPAVGAVGVE